jgi:hypothetical protein
MDSVRGSVLVAAVVAASTSAAAAESGQAVARWAPVVSQPFIATDADGFWTRNGRHHRTDGKEDVALALPEAVTEIERLAADARLIAVLAVEGSEEASTTVMLAFNREGKMLWRSPITTSSKGVSDLRNIDALGIDDAGEVILAGRFSGCMRFGQLARPTCVDEKAARRFVVMCQGDGPCRAPFVATYDRSGKVRSVVTPAGYPSRFVALARDGRIALAGDWSTKLDLDPDPQKAAVINLPAGTPKGYRPNSFWAVFEPGDGWRIVDGGGISGPGGVVVEGLEFDVDGTLVVAVSAPRRGGPPLKVTRGKESMSLDPALDGRVALMFVKGAIAPEATALDAGAHDPERELRLLPSAGLGVFGFGRVSAPPSAARLEVRKARVDLTLVALHGPANDWALRLGDAFTPTGVVTRPTEVCLGFDVAGEHTVAGARGGVTFGVPGLPSVAIGCFDLPPSPKGAPR